MKTTKILTRLLIGIALICFATTGMALASEDVKITGLVSETESGFIIAAEDAEYQVLGYNMSKMVGKKVTATGQIMEVGEDKALAVTKVEPAE